MTFRIYDSRRRELCDLTPLEPGKVRIYNCGPTVYSDVHIGNFRSFVFADLLRRALEWDGYDVTQVMNITDVGHLTEDDRADSEGEDKLQKKAAELGWDPFQVARHFEESFHLDRAQLAIQDAHHYPRATEHIADMLVQIQQLLDRGHAYIPEGSGEAYFDIRSFPAYGELSGKHVDDLVAGARVEINQRKRHPADFALWKVDEKHLMQWDPHAPALWEGFPGGQPRLDAGLRKGFPGWHIECSAMSTRYLGQTFDIHTGGEDNIFPHHECEIAQARGATGSEFSRYWMHARFLLVDGAKMSKRAGTLYRLADITERGFTPLELRYVLLANHYRQPMNFTFEGLSAARSSIQRLRNARALLCQAAGGSKGGSGSAEAQEVGHAFEQGFGAGLRDDLNVSNALAALFAFATAINKGKWSPADAAYLLEVLDKADHVLGVLREEDTKTGVIAPEQLDASAPLQPGELQALLSQPLCRAQVEQLAAGRHQARKQKDWATADAIRDHLAQAGVTFEDLPEGLRYRLP